MSYRKMDSWLHESIFCDMVIPVRSTATEGMTMSFELKDVVEIKVGVNRFRSATVIGFSKSGEMVEVKMAKSEATYYHPEEIGLVRRVIR